MLIASTTGEALNILSAPQYLLQNIAYYDDRTIQRFMVTFRTTVLARIRRLLFVLPFVEVPSHALVMIDEWTKTHKHM